MVDDVAALARDAEDVTRARGVLPFAFSHSHGARPVHQIVSMIKWIPTSTLSMKKISAKICKVLCNVRLIEVRCTLTVWIPASAGTQHHIGSRV